MSVAGGPDEAERIRETYARRSGADRYVWHKADVLWALYRRHSILASMLRRSGREDLSKASILDVGCGHGAWLRSLIEWGADPGRCCGIDLIPARIDDARRRSPTAVKLVSGDGGPLPWADGYFDLVAANTVFSSILDPDARLALAREMRRVTSRNGAVVIYDFGVGNPSNVDVTGIASREIGRLFPGAVRSTRSLTLAPPLARVLCPWSPALAAMLEWSMPFLRTHTMHVIEFT